MIKKLMFTAGKNKVDRVHFKCLQCSIKAICSHIVLIAILSKSCIVLIMNIRKKGKITAGSGELSALNRNCRKPVWEDKGNSYAFFWMLTNVRLIMEVATLGFRRANGCNCHPVGLLGLTSTDYDNFLRPQNKLKLSDLVSDSKHIPIRH